MQALSSGQGREAAEAAPDRRPMREEEPAATGSGGYRQPVVGLLRLGFCYDAAARRTRLREQVQRPPLQVVRAFATADGGALVHVHNLSGGVLGGDLYEVEVEVGAATRVMLTSTGATRLYRAHSRDQPAEQRWRVHVGSGALLEHLPDALIPFAGARYRQQVSIALDEGAGLLWWDLLAPGRLARGECFAYDLLELTFKIVAPRGPLACERFRLEPSRRPPRALARLGPFRYCASLYVCHTGLPPQRWPALEEELMALAQELSQPGCCLWGVSRLAADGLLVRGLALESLPLSQGLPIFWRLARLRLYGRTVPLPRKIY
ncbi:urease accessory protein UreD [Thermogemmatispora sp.]|uniref:urease accessory protein UreD n=1 Tax=Thermogemmatispora sp. TaxID=1968838 RepID=UPI0035E40AED